VQPPSGSSASRCFDGWAVRAVQRPAAPEADTELPRPLMTPHRVLVAVLGMADTGVGTAS
jgi:hypothetical protein